MKKSLIIALGLVFLISSFVTAQRQQRQRRQRGNSPQRNSQPQPNRGSGALAVPENVQAIGSSGIAWYTTWETGLAEAKRSNRPIFFMSAATVCSGVPGVF